jgi:hypothetical protein
MLEAAIPKQPPASTKARTGIEYSPPAGRVDSRSKIKLFGVTSTPKYYIIR